MLASRRYFRSRRAWSPRFWPTVLPLALTAAAVSYVFHLHALWQAVALWFVFGGVGMQLRWVIWRRRHPVISHDQYISDLRRAAPWN